MSRYDEELLGGLLRALPAPPPGWVEAARTLPALRGSMDDLAARAEADAEERRKTLADLEGALRAEGIEPDRAALAALRARLRG
jgi:hypothetical protein